MNKNKKSKEIVEQLARDLFVNNPVDAELNKCINELMSHVPTEKERQSWLKNKVKEKRKKNK